MKRGGATLIEMMVAIGVSGIVLTLVTTLLAALWQAERRVRAETNQRQSLARLELALRNDVHAAASASVAEDGALRLTMSADQVIAYSVDRQRVVRTTFSGGKEDHRESYLLAAGCDVAWTVEDRLVRTTIEPGQAADSRNAAAVAAVVEAALGAGRMPSSAEEAVR